MVTTRPLTLVVVVVLSSTTPQPLVSVTVRVAEPSLLTTVLPVCVWSMTPSPFQS